MQLISTAIPDVKILESQVFGDNRGFFQETYRKEVFEAAGIKLDFVQDNHSSSSRGVLRGLHYQLKQPQGKLIRVIEGEIFDVAVDLRKSSSTFGQWVGEYLSAENRKALWVPPGFAHGFCVVSETAQVVYKCTDYYLPEAERCLFWNDPEVGIEWPLLVSTILSAKDKAGLPLAQCDVYP